MLPFSLQSLIPILLVSSFLLQRHSLTSDSFLLYPFVVPLVYLHSYSHSHFSRGWGRKWPSLYFPHSINFSYTHTPMLCLPRFDYTHVDRTNCLLAHSTSSVRSNSTFVKNIFRVYRKLRCSRQILQNTANITHPLLEADHTLAKQPP